MSVARATILLIGVVWYPALSSAQPLAFQRDDRPSTMAARGIATADFNRDGWLDVVTAHNNPDGVAVLINRGASGGYDHTFIALPGGPFDVVTGDLNKDGLPDVAVANADAHLINVLFGRLEGGFAASVDLPGGANPRGLTVADVDRDGNPDIVFTEFAGARATIHWGSGTQTFLGRPSVSVATTGNPQGVAVADFNIDGRPDIVVASSGTFNAGITIQFADATPGAFTRWDINGTPQLNVLTVGDFDKDGRPDVAAAGSSTSDITTLVNTRGGWSIRTFASGGSSPRGIVAVDLNRDGAVDLVSGARGTSTVQIALGNGDGRFSAPEGLAAGSGSRAVAHGDFDNDGRIDVASANEYASSLTVFSNETVFPRSAFAFSRQLIGPGANLYSSDASADVADFDIDGKLDVAVNGAGVHVHLGNGTSRMLTGESAIAVATADVDRDGFADVVAIQTGAGTSDRSRIETYLGDGTGNFPGRRTSPTPLIVRYMEVADLNRDGRPDVLILGRPDRFSTSTQIQLWIGLGDGGFGLSSTVLPEPSATTLNLGDVDRDGDLDLVTYVNPPRGGTVTLVDTRLNDGDGNFASPQRTPVAGFDGIHAVALGDVNHDGWPDLAAAGFPVDFVSHRRIAVLLGGPSGFGEPLFLTTSESALGMTIADLTLDGHPDVLTDDGVLFKGRGDGTFEAPELFDFFVPDLQIVDFNKDGLPDIFGPEAQRTAQVNLNLRRDTNNPPTVDLTPDFTMEYRYQFGDGELELSATATDPDLHKPTFRWRLPDGTVIDTGTFGFLTPPHLGPGRHEFVVEASDGRGGTASDSMVITVLPEKEIVLHVGVEFWSQPFNNWQIVDDPTAASGKALHDVNAGQPKITTPSASPGSYVDVSFIATNTETYKLWVRLKADGNHWSNDSLWLQFSGAVDANGRSYAPGTTSGIEVNLEECSGCGVSGWGWRDEAWGQRDAIGLLTLKFEKNGWQTLRIQTREDGVSIDQVVLSAEKYRTTRPGAVKNDSTILPGIYYW